MLGACATSNAQLAAAEGALFDDADFAPSTEPIDPKDVFKVTAEMQAYIDNEILRGVTRTTLIDLLEREGIELVERPFTIAEAKAAREAFVTSATNLVMPVVAIDGAPVGNGAPGLLATKLRAAFHSAAETAPA